ncbi:MAG: 50S ribosomal protein L11 methyltransferase [Prolixibacteraceae bacterium]|nr:50S ribosomal protein L11 methyltransferase [Prolixibacteraceae bacterium]MBN2648679.1 50S ribosomal protein L11 methyltransferase [Prolixibacteraceae bacterium]
MEKQKGKFDLVLANINYNVFSRYFSQVAALLAPSGSILVSGFMLKDEDGMKNLAFNEEMQVISCQTRDSWCALWLKKNRRC